MATKKGVALASVTLEGASMSNTPLISVIVPVFNAQRFLPKCIGSILNQSYKNLEVLLIDDGSTDKSLEICKKYEQKDSRVVFISQENGGVSSARNNGLRRANGEYICFVDSDDWIPRKSIQVLYEAVSAEDADLAVGSIKRVKEGRNDILPSPSAVNYIEDKSEFLNYVKQVFPGPVAKLYKKEIINKYSLYFPSGIAVGEDTIFLCSYLENCKTIISVSDTVYFYNRLNGSSATHKHYSAIGDWFIQIVESYARLCNHVDASLAKETISDIAKDYLLQIARISIRSMKRTDFMNIILYAYANLKQYILEKESVECTCVNEETLPCYLSKKAGAEKVYDELKRQINTEKGKISTVIKECIKRVLKAIKCMWYFDLKM